MLCRQPAAVVAAIVLGNFVVGAEVVVPYIDLGPWEAGETTEGIVAFGVDMVGLGLGVVVDLESRVAAFRLGQHSREDRKIAEAANSVLEIGNGSGHIFAL